MSMSCLAHGHSISVDTSMSGTSVSPTRRESELVACSVRFQSPSGRANDLTKQLARIAVAHASAVPRNTVGGLVGGDGAND
eukprot:9484805-Pyramimonas_sp.AAC.1